MLVPELKSSQRDPLSPKELGETEVKKSSPENGDKKVLTNIVAVLMNQTTSLECTGDDFHAVNCRKIK